MTTGNAMTVAPMQPIVTMPFTPYYDEDGITIYNADCKQVLPFIGRVDVLLTDPPYGIDESSKKQKSRQGHGLASQKDYGDYAWDKEPPPRWFLDAAQETAQVAILWGGNYYGLPASSCWLVLGQGQRRNRFRRLRAGVDEHAQSGSQVQMEVAGNAARADGRQEREPRTPDAKAFGADAVVSLVGAGGTNGSRPIHGVGDDVGSRKARRP
jgi:hypothetical protein